MKGLAEKLGTKWFNEGEKSSKYFMRLLNRVAPDSFEVLEGTDGTEVTDPNKIEELIVKFYKSLYEVGTDMAVDDNNFFDQIDSITGEEDAQISAQLNAAELLATLGTCKDSAPGPDGIPYSILKLLWPTYGELLAESWKYSLERRCLPPSHKLSFLKLIPKAGKDLKKLTNWRPITLSNCDHKLITKTYAKRLCEKLASKVGGRQTAYLKTRLINDNIRSMLATINLTNIEDNLKGLIVSLDAKKAFDSVSHKYIEACLSRFGCHSFVPIFRILYKELKTDIIINGKVVSGFEIKRGVKQGDALSCIIFIMCMEPLLRNIEANPNVEVIKSNLLNCELPKVYAYADGVSCAMKDSHTSLNALFNEYERLTKQSGLELNAEKTELIRLGSEDESVYHVRYKNHLHAINSQKEVKINGIFFQRDREAMINRNVDAAIARMDKHFRNWSRRNLSTLGKIVLAKTFGVSQIIYVLQLMRLNDSHFKKINAVLYKFIWNKHYLAAKAPERIKRDIVTNQIINGGLGMLDIVELDESLKLRALSRTLLTEHPFLAILKNKLNLDRYFMPESNYPKGIDMVADKGLELLLQDRKKLWGVDKLDSDRNFMATVRDLGLRDVVDRRGLGSISFFILWSRGLRKVRDLNNQDLESIRRHIDPLKIEKIRKAIGLNIGPASANFGHTYFTKIGHKPLHALNSKEIRLARSSKKPIQEFKLGIRLSPAESINWGNRLNKLTSTRHKNTLLRAVHGEIYTGEKLLRFNLTDTDKCPRCDEIESLTHKILTCTYVEKIWDIAIPLLRRLDTNSEPNPDRLKLITATSVGSSQTSITLVAEIFQNILYLKSEQEYLLHPKYFVKRAIKNLSIKEGNKKIKKRFIELMEELES